MSPTRARRAWLIGAVCVGCIAAAAQILNDLHAPWRTGRGIAARVNAHDIDEDSVARTVRGLQSGVRTPIAGAREWVIARMIDEELLVEHAVHSGAAETDPEVRAALVRSAITRINEEVAAVAPAEADLAAYFAAHRSAYLPAARYDVVPLYFDAPHFPDLSEAEARAATAGAMLGQGRPVSALSKMADALPFGAPGGGASIATLRNYYGVTLADAVAASAIGTPTAPVTFGRGVLMLYLDGKSVPPGPDYADVSALVAADFTRDAQEQALERLLLRLRHAARIDFTPPPRGP